MSHQRAIAKSQPAASESTFPQAKPKTASAEPIRAQEPDRFVADFSQVPVSHPDDAFEKEADRAATAALTGNKRPKITPIAQKSLQAKASDSPALAPELQSGLGRGGGKPLAKPTRTFFETRFQQDFSNVRVHTDGHARSLAQKTNAQALTYGNDIYFKREKFQPQTDTGQELLAHELTHTVQQQNAEPFIARRIATPEPAPTIQPPEAEQTASVDSTAQAILTDFRGDPNDQDHSIGRRLEGLDPISRQVVLSRVRAQLDTDEERAQLSQAITLTEMQEETQPNAQELSDADRGADRRDRRSSEEATEDTRVEQARNSAEQVAQAQAVAGAETQDVPVNPEARTSAAQTIQAQESAQEDTAEANTESGEQVEAAEEASAEATQESATEAGQNAESAQEEGQQGESETPSSLRELLEPAPQAAAEGEQADDYDSAAAQAEVQRLIGEIQTTAGSAEQMITAESGAARSTISRAARSAKADVQEKVQTGTDNITSAIGTRRTQINVAFVTLGQNISTEFNARQNETQGKGQTSKDNLSGSFAQHRTNVNNTVIDKIQEASQLTEQHVQSAGNRTDQQADEARRKGHTKAGTYPNTERGVVQQNAVVGVANRTEEEIKARKPETVEAIQEITENIPDEFREKGEEALNGFDDGLPNLLTQVDNQIESALEQLLQHHDLTKEQLSEKQTQLMAQLDGLQSSIMAQLQGILPQAEAQINAAEQSALTQLQIGPPQTIARIREVAEEAVQILSEAETPDIEASRAMAGQVLSFIEDASSDAIGSLNQGAAQIASKFNEVKSKARTGLQQMQQKAESDLQTLGDNASRELTEAETVINAAFSTTMTAFQASLTAAETEVETQLNQTLSEFMAELNTPLAEAEAKISEAENEGLAENDEALRDLDGSMREAASDAAWDYDHPVLSTIADIGAFIAGVIVGILLVLALVVVVIVAFKLIIAGLVALGVSLVVAKIILVVAALGLLAYGIYSAYQETGSIGGAILSITGIQSIANAFTQPGLSPFERGFAFGQGVGTLATFFIGRGMGRSINARFVRIGRLPNPSGLGRVGRIVHFAENLNQPGARGALPRAFLGTRPGLFLANLANRTGVTRLGSNIANRASSSRLSSFASRTAEAGANQLGRVSNAIRGRAGRVVDTVANTRPGRAVQRGTQRLGKIGETIDEGVEGAFSRAENTRPGQAVRNTLFGQRPSTSPSAAGQTSRTTPPAVRQPPPRSTGETRPLPANDNALPTSRGRVSRGRDNAGAGFAREGENVIRPDRFRRPGPQRQSTPPEPVAPAQAVPEEATLLRTGTDDVPVLNRPPSPNRPGLRLTAEQPRATASSTSNRSVAGSQIQQAAPPASVTRRPGGATPPSTPEHVQPTRPPSGQRGGMGLDDDTRRILSDISGEEVFQNSAVKGPSRTERHTGSTIALENNRIFGGVNEGFFTRFLERGPWRNAFSNAGSQVRIRPILNNGQPAPFYVIADNVAVTNSTGRMIIFDAKLTPGSPLTSNQGIGYPLISRNGGIIESRHLSGNMAHGTQLPATPVYRAIPTVDLRSVQTLPQRLYKLLIVR